jgi:Zn-dependent protease with chaperone function
VTARARPKSGSAPRFGPPDRVSFLAEQRRRRRQTWRLSALCTVAVVVVGLPLSVVLTPLAYAALLAALRLASLAIPVPPSVWGELHRLASLIPALFNAMGQTGHHATTGTLVAGAVLIVAPGMLASFIAWRALRALFLRAGTGGVLLTLAAREPRVGDLEEQQLADVVAEMAIAAGLPSPRVRLLDVPTANAAVVGSSPADAVVVVTRGLLETLDREQTEAVIGHLVASAGDGDLRIAVTIASAFHGMALALTTLQAMIGFSGSAWRDLAHTAKWALLHRGDAAAAEAVSEMMARDLAAQREDGIAAVITTPDDQAPKTALARAARAFPPIKVLLFPFYLPYVGVLLLGAELFMLRSLVAGPLVMLVWHTRRLLADAMAVQLTRDPDALAGALERLAEADTGVPNSQWVGHLFVVAPRTRQGADSGDDGVASGFGGFVGSHPSVKRRLKRLAAMGSSEAVAGASRRPSAATWLAVVLFAPLILLVALLLAFVVGMIFMLAGAVSLLAAGIALAVIARLLL